MTRIDERGALPQPSVARFPRPRAKPPTPPTPGVGDASRREPPANGELMRWADDGGAPPRVPQGHAAEGRDASATDTTTFNARLCAASANKA